MDPINVCLLFFYRYTEAEYSYTCTMSIMAWRKSHCTYRVML